MYLNDSRIQRYGVIVLGVVMASMVMLVLPFQETSHIPLLLLFGAVTASAWWAGVRFGQVKALRQSEERLQLLLESANLGI